MKNEDIKISLNIDEKTGCHYLFTIIKKYKNGIKPRLQFTSDNFKNSTSLYDYVMGKNIPYAINAGIFNTTTLEPECVVVKAGKVIFDRDETYEHKNPNDGENKRKVLYTLGITNTGELKIYEPKFSAKDIIKDGCNDAVMAFVPLIQNYEELKFVDDIVPYGSRIRKPRQIIGQLENGDYYILTAHSPGLTFQETRDLLKKHNIPFAYHLDGGSSTQTTYYNQLLTPIYRDKTGRKIPTIITFE